MRKYDLKWKYSMKIINFIEAKNVIFYKLNAFVPIWT